jgi:translation initiation factor 2-alpha kinase 4
MLFPFSIAPLVKKIRLKTMQSDTKIFREVNALSRLSHRNIVRYYTTWVETSEPQSTVVSDDSSAEFPTEDGTSVPETSERHLPINGGFYINIEDFDDLSGSKSSFPSIHFGRSSSPGTSGEDSSEDDGFGSLFRSASSGSVPSLAAQPTLSRTLYIQMVRYFYPLDRFFFLCC